MDHVLINIIKQEKKMKRCLTLFSAILIINNNDGGGHNNEFTRSATIVYDN